MKRIPIFAPPKELGYDFNNHGLVVQLVRISPCHGEGREFESRPDRQQRKKSLIIR